LYRIASSQSLLVSSEDRACSTSFTTFTQLIGFGIDTIGALEKKGAWQISRTFLILTSL
jgi:hypothetical protein